MTSGPIVSAVLKKENAVEDFRELIGATNPEEAKKLGKMVPELSKMAIKIIEND